MSPVHLDVCSTSLCFWHCDDDSSELLLSSTLLQSKGKRDNRNLGHLWMVLFTPLIITLCNPFKAMVLRILVLNHFEPVPCMCMHMRNSVHMRNSITLPWWEVENGKATNLPQWTTCLNGQLAHRDLSITRFLISLDATSGTLMQHFHWHLMFSVQWEM